MRTVLRRFWFVMPTQHGVGIQAVVRACTVLSLVLVMMLSTSIAFAETQTPQPDRLLISQTDTGYQFEVPVSRLGMFIPDRTLVRQQPGGSGATSNPRYFIFNDENRGLTVSGWFEPAHLYKGVPSLWSAQLTAWQKQGLEQPSYIEMSRVGSWETVFYEVGHPNSRNLHMRAHWVQAGTWIELHISLSGNATDRITKEALLGFLKSIVVSERADG